MKRQRATTSKPRRRRGNPWKASETTPRSLQRRRGIIKNTKRRKDLITRLTYNLHRIKSERITKELKINNHITRSIEHGEAVQILEVKRKE